MASWLRGVFVPIFISCILLLSQSVHCDHDEEDSLLESLNAYRLSLNLRALQKNENAECLADEVAEQFHKQPCTNTSGANTVPGTEPQLPNYLTLLSKCHLNVTNTRDGIVMPACVPNLDSSLLLSNFTRSQYSDYLNDTKFTGIGIGHEDNWMVVVLTTNTPEGSFAPAKNGVDTDDDHDDDDDDDKDHDGTDIDDNDLVLNGINAHRVTSRVAALVKSEAAECFADEFADRFQDQPCSNLTGSVAEPGPAASVSSYPEIAAKCNLNVTEGVVMSACAANSASDLVLSSLKGSGLSGSLDDPKFTGIGIGSEDDWKVVVLTAGGLGPVAGSPGSLGGPNGPNPFNKANAVDGINSINTATFVPKTSLVAQFILLLVASIFLL